MCAYARRAFHHKADLDTPAFQPPDLSKTPSSAGAVFSYPYNSFRWQAPTCTESDMKRICKSDEAQLPYAMRRNFYTIFSDRPSASPPPTQTSSVRPSSQEQQPKRARRILGASPMWPSERGEPRHFNRLTGRWLEERSRSPSDAEIPPDSETEPSARKGSNAPNSQAEELLRKTAERAGLIYEDVVAASSAPMARQIHFSPGHASPVYTSAPLPALSCRPIFVPAFGQHYPSILCWIIFDTASKTLRIEPDLSDLSEDQDTTIRVFSRSVKNVINIIGRSSRSPSPPIDLHDPDDFFSSGPRPPSVASCYQTYEPPSRDLTPYMPASPSGSRHLSPIRRQSPLRVYERTPHDPDVYYTSGARPSDHSGSEEPGRIIWSDEAGYDGGGEDPGSDEEEELQDIFYDAVDGQDRQVEGIIVAGATNEEPATKDDIIRLEDNMTKMVKASIEAGRAKIYPYALVRSEFEEMFSKSGDKVYGPSPTAAEKNEFLQLWEISKEACHARPIEQFCIDVRDTPRSPWNKSMSHVFANYVIKKYGFPNSDPEVRDRILHAFFVRVKGLHAQWTKSVTKHPTENAEEKAKGRSYQRKKADYDRRKETAARYTTLQKFVDVVDALGIAGMSSDESDSSSGQKTYSITQPEWRSAEIRTAMGMLDMVHSLTRASNAKRDSRGQHVRHRDQSEHARVSQRTAAPLRLPRNFYDAEWLQAQSLLWKDDVLQPAPEMDFTAGNEVFK
ncbi:hypothetical protein DENSPDRAFT_853345 [Dentipellis sp. KUC8613]|nr:hypothetical protein DENSPDRAFT_853345 [Dentipellis sp. KUC8613]